MLKKFMVFLLLAGLILTVGCSKEDNLLNSEDQPPGIPSAQQVQVPSQAPVEVQAVANTVNFYWNFGQAFFNALQQVKAVKENGKWVWVHKSGDFTVTVTAEKQDDGSFHWEVVVDGSYQGVVVSNYKAIEGDISADGKSGEWRVYDTDGSLVGTVTWTEDENGNVTGTVVVADSNQRIEFANNADGSGGFTMYEGQAKIFEAQWQADGSGWWKAYDENGNLINEGTWGTGS